MTEQDQQKALAELDGLLFTKGVWVGPGWNYRKDCKPYLTSYDAIIPLIQKQDEHVIDQMESMLGWQWDKTPSQLSEALLRATNKWKE